MEQSQKVFTKTPSALRFLSNEVLIEDIEKVDSEKNDFEKRENIVLMQFYSACSAHS